MENGSIQSINVDPIQISLQQANLFSESGVNLYLRKKTKPVEYKALLGPQSNSIFAVNENVFCAKGSWNGIDYICTLQLSEKSHSWQWSICSENNTDEAVELDLILVQDAGLSTATEDGIVNEYYVSQYLDRQILTDENYGTVICCRQNMKEATGNPWLMLACINKAAAASVDGKMFYGNTFRATGIPEGLITPGPWSEYAGESAVLALQEEAFKLEAGGKHESIFIVTYLPDHTEATSARDLLQLQGLIHEFKAISQHPKFILKAPKNLFNPSSFLPAEDLSDTELDRYFGSIRRHCEWEKEELLSFFSGENMHVVLRAKEIIVNRPHAHIMQTETGYLPDEKIMSSTSYACGVFNSHLTQGNTNFNIFLSVFSSQFNLSHERGQRIFVEIEGRKFLLGVPSAFEIGLNHCRWIYKFQNHCFQIRTWTSKKAPRIFTDFNVLNGKQVKILVTHHFDQQNGWKIEQGELPGEYIATPDAGSMLASKFPLSRFKIIVHSRDTKFKAGGDEFLFSDSRKRQGSFFILDVEKTNNFIMSFAGEVNSCSEQTEIDKSVDQCAADCQDGQLSWKDLSLNLLLNGEHEDIAALQEILPWYGMNAITHYLTPHGLEQTGGAAWGTRDIAQGPIGLLLHLQKYEEAKQVLRIVFSNQNPDGGWPQWWMFDSYSNIRSNSAHSDIFYWCIIALCNYIEITEDLAFINEVLPYYSANNESTNEKTPVGEHVERLVNMVVESFIPGTSLVPFGGGDWNDSMQPVSKELAKRMISSWTVEMNYQAFSRYQMLCEKIGNRTMASELERICENIKADFNTYLIKDDVVAGHALMEEDASISLLLHPGDEQTNIRYRLLPMTRGIISGIFTIKQARHHMEIIEKHLKGPDGARLMNRPPKYSGGIQTLFQRAESSAFFGREIGIMYMHAHLRYAESLACTGKADAFLLALRQANPVAYRKIVPCGDIRQSNCYYSSSDAAFNNRFEADERYEELKSGKITLNGGWRIYSSGPGLYIELIIARFLGIRHSFGNIILDPVIPDSLNGFSASMKYRKRSVLFRYTIVENNSGPKTIVINGKSADFSRENNPYRTGGAMIPSGLFLSMLDQADNMVEIQL